MGPSPKDQVLELIRLERYGEADVLLANLDLDDPRTASKALWAAYLSRDRLPHWEESWSRYAVVAARG